MMTRIPFQVDQFKGEASKENLGEQIDSAISHYQSILILIADFHFHAESSL